MNPKIAAVATLTSSMEIHGVKNSQFYTRLKIWALCISEIVTYLNLETSIDAISKIDL